MIETYDNDACSHGRGGGFCVWWGYICTHTHACIVRTLKRLSSSKLAIEYELIKWTQKDLYFKKICTKILVRFLGPFWGGGSFLSLKWNKATMISTLWQHMSVILLDKTGWSSLVLFAKSTIEGLGKYQRERNSTLPLFSESMHQVSLRSRKFTLTKTIEKSLQSQNVTFSLAKITSNWYIKFP